MCRESGTENIRDLFFLLPGIIRTALPGLEPGFIPLGFSFPVRLKGNRLRIASKARNYQVYEHMTPWQIAGLDYNVPDPYASALMALREAGKQCGAPVGVFGAVALQIVTGLEYLHEKSDLDVIIPGTDELSVRQFWREVRNISLQFQLVIDGEVLIQKIGYVKLSELVSTSSTVLVKGGRVSGLMPMNKVWQAIAASSV